MKISSDQAKAGVIIGAGLLAAYVLWRAYRVAGDAQKQVSASVTGAVDAVAETGDNIQRVWNKAVNKIAGAIGTLPSNDGYPEAGPIRKDLDQATVDRINRDSDKVIRRNEPITDEDAAKWGEFEMGGNFGVASHMAIYPTEDSSLYQTRQVRGPIDSSMA